MEKYFSISKAAEIVNMTTEALRHYDRIGLVKPCKTDEWTGYRYYSQREIVMLNTVSALRSMGMPLKKIKDILQYDDFKKIIDGFEQALRQADIKIKELEDAKRRIERAKRFYESKAVNAVSDKVSVRNFPERVIMLSENLTMPTIDNLYNYHRHFYAQIDKDKHQQFSFADEAGVFHYEGKSAMFAVCIKYAQSENLKVLPGGRYLCAKCSDKTYKDTLQNMLEMVKEKYNKVLDNYIQMISLTGILQWEYEIQIYIDNV